MTKLLIAGFLTGFTGIALAEVNCLADKGEDVLKVKVIDTFIDRMAFISRPHPSANFPLVGISVKTFEKSKSMNFVNLDYDFHLSIDKVNYQRSYPVLYKAELSLNSVSIEMDCTVE